MIDLPSDLSDQAAALLAPLFEESDPYPAPVTVDAHLIRHWCEAFEDVNPLYLDGNFARAHGHPEIVAPPVAVVSTFSQPYRPQATPRHIHFEVKEILGCSHAIVSQLELENEASLHLGDRLVIRQRLVSVSPLRRTRLGEGRFWTIERRYRNQHGELIATQQMTAFGYGQAPDSERDSDGGGNAIEATIGKIQDDARRSSPLRWDDAVVGTTLPTMMIPITQTRCVYVASATRDFGPQHSDPGYAQSTDAAGVFVSSPFVVGMISRYLTDWAGPLAVVRRVRLQLGSSIVVGDEMTLSGTVTARQRLEQAMELEIAIEITTQRGPAMTCTALVRISSDPLSRITAGEG